MCTLSQLPRFPSPVLPLITVITSFLLFNALLNLISAVYMCGRVGPSSILVLKTVNSNPGLELDLELEFCLPLPSKQWNYSSELL